ncbi:MAG: HipA family kinase, partial [Myxococcales bacterium]
MLRTVHTTRYVTPLREGGSLPALIEASDDGMYVLKLRGAGQGPRALVAELIAGELARVLGLPIPELVFAHLSPAFGHAEPDREISDLLSASAGLNVALDFLPGALPFHALLGPGLDPALASAVVWFDAFVSNVDRTAKNPNLLMWHDRLWLIDHGAALYVHHGWSVGGDPARDATSRFPLIKDHVLLPFASTLHHADAFAVIRRGMLDVAILGGLQVDVMGDLANWIVPGERVHGIGGGL